MLNNSDMAKIEVWLKPKQLGFINPGQNMPGFSINWQTNFQNNNRSNSPYDLLGQKFQKVENDENRFFAITSSKLFKN